MSYLQFDKNKLVNLEYSLSKEIIRSNRAGSYALLTAIGCNTRKYHGLLICPIDEMDGEKHVLLSSLDETIIDKGKEFNLGIHKYEGDNYNPKGHKYVIDFEAEIVAKTTYGVGNVVLVKESLLVEKEQQVFVRYTLQEAQEPIKMRFKPFLAFRNHHALSKANLYVNTKVKNVRNGVMTRLYEGYPGLYMQFSKKVEFVHVPDWYYNIEYMKEMERGYDYKEDLFVPGYFELSMKKGEVIIFSAATSETNPLTYKKKYIAELANRLPRTGYYNCLRNSAEQFIVKRNDRTEVIAGFPWFDTWGRDTFIALPGLTIALRNPESFVAVMDTMVKRLKNGLFPNTCSRKDPSYNSIDCSLWFIWAMQQLKDYDSTFDIWKKYGVHIKNILKSYREGTLFNIKMHDNGLIYGGVEGMALTWMDAIVNGVPVTARIGYPVEVNALWYNALLFSLQSAKDAGDKHFIRDWRDIPEKTAESFINLFWDEEKGYLADYVYEDTKDMSVRPNMVIAAAMTYSPLTTEMKKSILDIVESELLTPRGLRTLSPKNPDYKGVYEGNQEQRDLAYHQGTARPWLLEHFCKAYLDIHKLTGLALVKRIYQGFEEEMNVHGIGSVSEVYNGDPPHRGRGAISQACNVAALLRIRRMIKNLS